MRRSTLNRRGTELAAGALIAALASSRRRAQARAAAAAIAAARARDEQRSERERLERHARRLERERTRHAQIVQRLRQSWQAEREWSRELRAQIQRLDDAGHGTLGEDDDVRALILGAAIQLVDAEKGLLIAREDDGGTLAVVRSQGFEHDPSDSAIARRFAEASLARDEILRENDPADPGPGKRSPADAEIESLVAIPVYLRDELHGVIVCANRAGGFEEIGDELLLALGDHAGAALQHGRLQHELRDSHRSAVRLLAEAVAAHDPVLHRESGELAVHAGLLAHALELDEHARDVVVCATLLRAVGYLALPERPRLRPGELSPDERSLIELHPRVGFNIMVQAPSLRDVATTILYHHERFDGTGYPAGLSGRDIPLESRMLAVLEAYGAMTHERPYRTPLTSAEACAELVAAGGEQLDPEVCALFVEQVRRAPRVARDDVSEAVLDALPLEGVGERDGDGDGLVTTTSVDALTLLGDRRGMQHDVDAAARHTSAFALLLIELADLADTNREGGFVAGDRLIQQAARRARAAAARLGGTAYRVSGRRLAILVPAREGALLANMVEEVRDEFLSGPAVRVAMSAWIPGETGEAVIARTRRALEREPA
jgi:HD-GYP domain-containing protein (c-di-GMP phosphodiesterase class II)/GGDEF domain-containing protein